jgi:hypothetical protein
LASSLAPSDLSPAEPVGPLGSFLSSRVSGSGETVSSTLVSFTSPSKTHRIERGSSWILRSVQARAFCCSSHPRLSSSLGVLKDHPSIDIRSRCPLPDPHRYARAALRVLRPRHATASVRSVLVVPPDFDGFLHLGAAGLLHPAADPGIHHVSDGWVGIVLSVPCRVGSVVLPGRCVPAASWALSPCSVSCCGQARCLRQGGRLSGRSRSTWRSKP